tara:strand:- start:876 stop:2087 length:1212 start_codon:yes stop_codon:yes gene_type:complete
MYDHLIHPSPLLSLLLDIGNYSVFLIIFLIAKQKKIISNNLFILSGIMMLTPFFINGVIINWTQFPDQSKYLLYAKEIRSNLFLGKSVFQSNFGFNHNYTDLDFQVDLQFLNYKVKVATTFFAFAPLISIETFKSIGFFNRAIFIITLFFFINKTDLPFYVKLFFILSPSLIVYSSVSLRDNLVLITLIWSLYFFLKKYYFRLIISCVILFFIKLQSLVILIFIFYIICLFTDSKIKKFKFVHIIILLTVISIGYLYAEQLLEFGDSAREGLYIENNGFYKSITANTMYQKLSFDGNFFTTWFKQTVLYIISPLSNMTTGYHFVVFFEITILYFYLYINFYKDFKIKKIKNLTIIWVLVFFITTILYSMFMFNDGMIARSRFVWVFFILIGYEMHKNIYLKKS